MADQITFTAPLGDFADAVANVAVFAGTDDTLPVLRCVQLTIGDGNVVTLAATDRYMLAIQDFELAGDYRAEGSGEMFLTPDMIKALGQAKKAAGRSAGMMPLTVTLEPGEGTTDNRVRFDSYDFTQTFRVADHFQFPRWRRLLPTEHKPCEDTTVAFGAALMARFAKLRPVPAAVRMSISQTVTRWQAGELHGIWMRCGLDSDVKSAPVAMPHAEQRAPESVAA